MFALADDFLNEIESLMEAWGISRGDLAERLGISERCVSKTINNPSNFTLRSAVDWARALNLKVTLFPYDDGDKTNTRGPVFPEVFLQCWETLGKPTEG